MRLMTQGDIQSTCIDILKRFDVLCQENKLSYSLAYGTLLGAVRHHGFIPWDDDIDVVMPRNDYDKFISLFEEDEKYAILFHTKTNGYFYPYMKMYRKDTRITETWKKMNTALGVYIDIFPLDYCGDSEEYAIKVKDKMKNLEKYLLVSMEDDMRRLCISKRICHRLVKTIPGNFYYSYLERILNSVNMNRGLLVNLVWGYDSRKEVGAFTGLDDLIRIRFESYEFNAIKDYEHFLRHVYNNYMELPPKEKQVTHHDFDAFWIDE